MKRVERKIALHCAVYTRVSTDSGLEQDFNSLDNQREASGALGMLPSRILFDPRNRFSFNPLSHLGFALETIDHRLSPARK